MNGRESQLVSTVGHDEIHFKTGREMPKQRENWQRLRKLGRRKGSSALALWAWAVTERGRFSTRCRLKRETFGAYNFRLVQYLFKFPLRWERDNWENNGSTFSETFGYTSVEEWHLWTLHVSHIKILFEKQSKNIINLFLTNSNKQLRSCKSFNMKHLLKMTLTKGYKLKYFLN